MNRLTRREALELGAAVGVAALFEDGVDARVSLAAPRPHPRGTTLEHTILRGAQLNAGGYRKLKLGPGEPHLVRDDLGTAARRGRAARRTALLAVAQFTDIHIQDSQSPARVEFLDRLSDGANGNDAWTSAGQSLDLFGASYRPQEMLTAHVAEALVRAVNATRRRPGHRPSPRLRDRDRRRGRQLPVQRAALGDRPARRRVASVPTRAT